MALIERETAIEAALDWNVKPGGEVFNAIKAAIRSRLEQVAAIDAVPVVHGHWVIPEGSLWPVGNCSVCGEVHVGYKDAQFCPHCGAKMDGAPDTEDGKRRETDTIGRDDLPDSAE